MIISFVAIFILNCFREVLLIQPVIPPVYPENSIKKPAAVREEAPAFH
jgi:hypothetical protein